jgi:7-cyano-7-deazaguanine synthase
VFGVHAGDHPIYPDCRPEFWAGVASAGLTGRLRVAVATPFLHLSKAEALAPGLAGRRPLELTWSCYRGGRAALRAVRNLRRAAEAFHLAGVPDPTGYTDPDYWRAGRGPCA